MSPVRVGLFDDEELVRDGLTAILESDPGVDVVCQHADGRGLVDAVRSGVRMDVALVDVQMPHLDGLAATRAIQGAARRPAVVILTTFHDEDYVLRALKAGASGFLLKRSTRHELHAAVRAAAVGDSVLSPAVTRSVISRMLATRVPPVAASMLDGLTPRELDVLRALGSGLTNTEIAAELFLSESTVKTHVSNVLTKTGSRDRVQAVLLAVRSRLVV